MRRKRLDNLIKLSGMSQREFCRFAGLNPNVLSSILSGEHRVSWLNAERLSSALGAPIDDLNLGELFGYTRAERELFGLEC